MVANSRLYSDDSTRFERMVHLLVEMVSGLHSDVFPTASILMSPSPRAVDVAEVRAVPSFTSCPHELHIQVGCIFEVLRQFAEGPRL